MSFDRPGYQFISITVTLMSLERDLVMCSVSSLVFGQRRACSIGKEAVPTSHYETKMDITKYIHTNHSRFISEGVAEASQILLQNAHVLLKLLSYEEYCRRDKW
jgi:hypothetical protein